MFGKLSSYCLKTVGLFQVYCNMTYPSGHLFPDFGMLDTRSKSWKTLLLAPAAFMAVEYNPDKEETADPTAGGDRYYIKILVAKFCQ